MRTEWDSIGSVDLPDDAYYSTQTERARVNFPMTGRKMHPYMIESLVQIKKAAAIANLRAGEMRKDISDASCAPAMKSSAAICGISLSLIRSRAARAPRPT